MADKFTIEDFRNAEKVLRENAVPPAKCDKCGAEVYLLKRAGKAEPDHWRCDCGAKNPVPEHGGFLPIARTS